MGLGLALDLRPVAFGLQRFFPLLARMAPVGIDVAARVAGIKQRLEVLAVVGAGRVGLQTPDELVLAIERVMGSGFSRIRTGGFYQRRGDRGFARCPIVMRDPVSAGRRVRIPVPCRFGM
jgi:hypothetical protein